MEIVLQSTGASEVHLIPVLEYIYLLTFQYCKNLNKWLLLLFRLLCRSRSLPESCFYGGGGWSSAIQPEGQGETYLCSVMVFVFGPARYTFGTLISLILTSSWYQCIKLLLSFCSHVMLRYVIAMVEVSMCVCLFDVQVFIFTVDKSMLRVVSEVSGKEVRSHLAWPPPFTTVEYLMLSSCVCVCVAGILLRLECVCGGSERWWSVRSAGRRSYGDGHC